LTALIDNSKFTTDINEKSKVLLSTIHSFKGLENKVIIISNIDKIRDEFKKELLYVACSRAKHILIVIGDEKDLALFQKNNQQEAA
jgi:ATP-dependent exoDNAse (exonuclease V) alpha subunit